MRAGGMACDGEKAVNELEHRDENECCIRGWHG